MSIDRCRSCRYVGYCTFPKSRVITECDEFEDMSTAQTHEWDLQSLMKLWTDDEAVPENPT
jgi:hypothetical protein